MFCYEAEMHTKSLETTLFCNNFHQNRRKFLEKANLIKNTYGNIQNVTMFSWRWLIERSTFCTNKKLLKH